MTKIFISKKIYRGIHVVLSIGTPIDLVVFKITIEKSHVFLGLRTKSHHTWKKWKILAIQDCGICLHNKNIKQFLQKGIEMMKQMA